MHRSQRLTYGQVRAAAELVGQAVELGADPTAWRRHLLARLPALVGGRVGLTVDLAGLDGRHPPRMVDPLDHGFDDADRWTFYHDYVPAMADDPGTRAVLGVHAAARFATAVRRQLVDDATWYAAPAVAEMRRAGDVDDFVYSCVRVGPAATHGFVLYRDWGDQPFEARHRRLVRLVHAGLLRHVGEPDPGPLAALPSRARQVLDLLRAGRSMKQVAANLGISRHTVNDHTKRLHKAFDVSSRTELLARTAAATRPPGLTLPHGFASL